MTDGGRGGAMRAKARDLAQHDGPTGLLEESDPAWTVHAACPDGPHHLPQSGADQFLNVHKTPSRVTTRKEGMAWYSS